MTYLKRLSPRRFFVFARFNAGGSGKSQEFHEFKKQHDSGQILKQSLLLYIGFSLACLPSKSADWGYEPPAEKKPIEEQSAAPLAKSILKTKLDKATVAPTPAIKKATKIQSNKEPGTNSGINIKSAKQDSTKESSTSSGASTKSTKQTTSPSGSAGKSPPQQKSATLSTITEGAPTEAFLDRDQQAVRCWLQMFQACNKQPMEYAEQKRVEAYMLQKGKQNAKNNEELRSILKFWPKLLNDLHTKPEMEMHYTDLFRALLRLHERNAPEKTHVEGSEFSSDEDLITVLLGLQRVAVPGNPQFTEDAVNAYADMAVFIYEQRHDGKTIDANDNRALFAKVVVEKFNRAPTDADQRAMASFDLAWAKFKIIWFSSDASTRKILLEKLEKTGANSTLTVAKDPLMDAVLSNWPWKTTP